MLALCSYCLDKCDAADVLEILPPHGVALAKRDGQWIRVEPAGRRRAEDLLRHSQQALRESEERFRTAIETSPDAIILIDLNGFILVANREAARFAGFSTVEELLARKTNIYEVLSRKTAPVPGRTSPCCLRRAF